MIFLEFKNSVNMEGEDFNRNLGSYSFCITYVSVTVIMFSRSFKILWIIIIFDVTNNLICGG